MALIKFVQDDNIGADGQSLKGDLEDPVEVSHSASDTTPIGSWEISLLDLPFDSELTLGVLAQANGATPAAQFQPDVAGGCYRVMLRTWPQVNRQGRVDVDIRNFGVVGANGFLPPPSMIWPEPLPDPRTGRPGAKPNELNFGGQTHGWSGLGNDGLLRHLILALTLGLVPPLFGSGVDGPYQASSGTLVLTKDTYFTTIDLSGTATIDTAGYKIYASQWCKQVGGSKIWCAPSHGGNASGTTGGIAGSAPPAGTTLAASAGGGGGTAGGDGVSSDAATGSSATTDVANGWGGKAGASGAGADGGAGFNGNGGGGGAGGSVTVQHATRELVLTDLLTFLSGTEYPSRVRGGAGGRGGGSGQWGSDGFGSWRSGAGGGGGGGGGALFFAFAEYITDATTQAGALAAPGGNGGNGSNAVAGDTSTLLSGGGSGGSGGGGGVVYGYWGKRTGPVVAGLIDISGGNGGNGGNGAQGTTPLNQSKNAGGSGAGGGQSGQAFVYDIGAGSGVRSRWANAATAVVPCVASNPPNLVGATGNPATVTQLAA